MRLPLPAIAWSMLILSLKIVAQVDAITRRNFYWLLKYPVLQETRCRMCINPALTNGSFIIWRVSKNENKSDPHLRWFLAVGKRKVFQSFLALKIETASEQMTFVLEVISRILQMKSLLHHKIVCRGKLLGYRYTSGTDVYQHLYTQYIVPGPKNVLLHSWSIPVISSNMASRMGTNILKKFLLKAWGIMLPVIEMAQATDVYANQSPWGCDITCDGLDGFWGIWQLQKEWHSEARLPNERYAYAFCNIS